MQALPKKKLSEKNKAAIQKLYAKDMKPGAIGRKLKIHGQQVAGYTRTLVFLQKLPPQKNAGSLGASLARIEGKTDLLMEEVAKLRAGLERGMVIQMQRLQDKGRKS